MRKEDSLTPAEREFEQALAGLQPAGSSIHRDQLMYRAGYEAAARRARPWQALAALLVAALTATLAMQGLTYHSERHVQFADSQDRVRQALTATDADADEIAEPRYLVLRTEVLEKGLAALPAPAANGVTRQPRPTLEELLGEPPAVRPAKQLTIMDRILLGDQL